jgi:hypothetical protein
MASRQQALALFLIIKQQVLIMIQYQWRPNICGCNFIYIWIKLGKTVLLQDFTAILLWKPVGFVAFDLLTQVWCVQQSSRTLRSHFPSSGEGARMGHELHEEMHCFTKSTGFQDETLSLYVILWYGSSCTAWVGCLTSASGREPLIAWSNTSWEW